MFHKRRVQNDLFARGGPPVLNREIPAWKRTFYRSKAWQECRKVVIDRQFNICADCIKNGDITPIDEVHHLTFLTPDNVGDPNISLNPDNCVGLCTVCHNRRHEKGFKGETRASRVWFDENGVPHSKK